MALEDMMNDTISGETSEVLLHKWDAMLPLIDHDFISVREIKSNEGDKFVFDFNGLLNFLNIPEEFWYIHVRLNNFNSSTNYNGGTNIALIDSDYLNSVYNAFTNKS